MKRLLCLGIRSSLVLLTVLALGAPRASAQDVVGGPYEPDSNTVLLLHFDGDLTNQSEHSADGVGHGDYSFLSNNLAGMGQMLRLDNDSKSDSSFVTIADTAALDLTGSWTIEGWVNIFSFGETSDDWRWVPRLMAKPGSPFYTGNYYMEIWGDARLFKLGYHTTASGSGQWIEVNTPNEMVEAGQWYHWTYIRDAEKNVLVSLIHNADRELVFFGVNEYDPLTEDPPLVNDNPLHIGFAGGGADSWLDGFVDEIRISNTVRDFSIPPILTAGTVLANQPTGNAYPVSVDASRIGPGTVDAVTLHYNDGNGWQELPMTLQEGTTYAASIPAQPFGATVQYYFSASDANGLRATLPSSAETAEQYYSFGVYEPVTQTLDLDFEEGQGIPTDDSQYAHEVTFLGQPTYTDVAVEGDFALALEGDSSIVEIDNSPFLASEEMHVELWFNADTLQSNVRLIGKQNTGAWWQQNYEIKFLGGGGIAAGSYIPGRPGDPYIINEMALDTTLQVNTWYQAIYELTADSALFLVRDVEGNTLDQVSLALDGRTPIIPSGPFRLGRSGGADQPSFRGKVDAVKIYNYAIELAATADEDGATLPAQIALSQNYPNPFNPTTNIRYALSQAGDVTLRVYDVLGREVMTLVDTQMPAGSYQVRLDGSQLASGVYFYQLKTEQMTMTRKMLLVK